MSTQQKKTTVTVPDGRGGWTTIEGVTAPGQKANEEKQAAAAKAAFIKESAEYAGKLMQYAQLIGREQGLGRNQLAFAVALLSINVRENFPSSDDPKTATKDPEAFDAVAKAAQDYFDANSR